LLCHHFGLEPVSLGDLRCGNTRPGGSRGTPGLSWGVFIFVPKDRRGA